MATFEDSIRAAFSPKPPEPSDTLRVADLFCGAGELSQAARRAGVEVVYAEDPDAKARRVYTADTGIRAAPRREKIPFDRISEFDILTVRLPDGSEEQAFGRALRFLRIRRPHAFVLAGDGADDGEFLRLVWEKTHQLGYEISANRGRSAYVVGASCPFPAGEAEDVDDEVESVVRKVVAAVRAKAMGED